MNKQSGAFEDIECVARITATLVTEGCVGLELMSAAGFADGYGVEICRLQEDVLGILRHTALESSENAGDTHCFFFVGNHEVACVYRTLYAIEGYEFIALVRITNVDLVTFDLVGIEGMERLSALVQDEVRDIDDVVNRAKSDSEKATPWI